MRGSAKEEQRYLSIDPRLLAHIVCTFGSRLRMRICRTGIRVDVFGCHRAVGIIIGGAFGKIVTSVVNDIIMPVVGALTGGGSFGTKYLWLSESENPGTLEAAKSSCEAYIAWGPIVQTTIDFLIIAFAIFMMIKVMNKAQSLVEADKPTEDEAPAVPPEDILLLREIRDSLAKS